jgi:cytidylate kinase
VEVATVTISASYGAGGSVVGPAVAQKLGLPFLDRTIPVEVARRLQLPPEEASARDERVDGRFLRLLRSFTPLMGPLGPEVTPMELPGGAEAFRDETEAVIREAADGTGAVILGRAAMVVLKGRPDVLCVRLDGPTEERLAQACRHDPSLDRASAEQHQRDTDRTRDAYVRAFYGVHMSDPGLYHLVIDSTALPLDACIEVILRAAEGRFAP